VVVYRGGPRPRVLFVGEAPGAEEDAAGEPFVGRSGRRLDRAIAALGLEEGEFGIMNVIKCRPPKNRFLPLAARTCRPFLDRQLALLRPEVIVTLGAHALRAFDPTAPPVTEAAGRPRRWGSTRLIPLLHPAAAMHAPRYRARWDDDVERLKAQLADPARRR
jgi:uracil-DNA glycosylase